MQTKVKCGFVVPEELQVKLEHNSIGEQLIKYKLVGETYEDAISKIESDLRCLISQSVVDRYRKVWDNI